MPTGPSTGAPIGCTRATATPSALASVGVGIIGATALAGVVTAGGFSIPGSDAVADQLRAADGAPGYALVFVLAAIPLFEILLVIPPAVALGMDPLLVGVLAFGGNALSACAYVAAHDRFRGVWPTDDASGDGATGGEDGDATGGDVDDARGDGATGGDDGDSDSTAGRRGRGRRLWDRFGLGGLALAAPVATGTHLAAALAMVFGARGRAVAGWLVLSLALWTVGLVVVSAMGVRAIGGA